MWHLVPLTELSPRCPALSPYTRFLECSLCCTSLPLDPPPPGEATGVRRPWYREVVGVVLSSSSCRESGTRPMSGTPGSGRSSQPWPSIVSTHARTPGCCFVHWKLPETDILCSRQLSRELLRAFTRVCELSCSFTSFYARLQVFASVYIRVRAFASFCARLREDGEDDAGLRGSMRSWGSSQRVRSM